MKNTTLKVSSKTKVLNLFRRVFTLPFLEKMLVNLLLKKKSAFLIKLIPPEYLFPNNSIRKVQRNGINFELDISNVVDHYLYWGLEYDTYQSILDEIGKAKVILDVGANIGVTSLFFASQNPTAKIISFEPHPSNFERLIRNISLNPNLTTIQPVNSALGESQATLKMYEIDKNNPGNNQIITETIDLPSVDVEIKILDKYIESMGIEVVDFMKIDVEGFEYFVLKGAENMLRSNHPLLFIEIDDEHLKKQKKSPVAILEFLVSVGYHSFQRTDNFEYVTTESNFTNCHFDIIAR